jgi:glycosyltransferase involved in cell wall biosynthesis
VEHEDMFIISVVICTYNRANLLSQCLHSLGEQTLDNLLFEVLVINNNSTDNTQEIAESFSNISPNLRVIIESKQGLSHARNRGASEAKGKYIAYLDDDCSVPKDWLETAQSIIAHQAPAAFGGPYYAFYLSPKPDWFKDEYGSHVQGAEPKALYPEEFLDGGNFFINRELLLNLGGFNPVLGMTGSTFGYGEETELQLRIRNEYPDSSLMYFPQLFVYHLVRKEKMIITSIIYQSFQRGRSSAYMFMDNNSLKKHESRYIFENVVLLVVLILSFPLRLLCRDRMRYPFVQNYCYEKGVRIFSLMGSLYEMLVISSLKAAQKLNSRGL